MSIQAVLVLLYAYYGNLYFEINHGPILEKIMKIAQKMKWLLWLPPIKKRA